MKKFMKPIAFLFALAMVTGAYAQDNPNRPIKKQLKEKEVTHHPKVTPRVRIKHQIVKNRKADMKRIVRDHGLTVAEIK